MDESADQFIRSTRGRAGSCARPDVGRRHPSFGRAADDAAREVVSAGGDDGQGVGDLADAHHRRGALGDDADGILPQAIRSAELRVRLPRHHINMLEYRTEQQETTVSGVLARELDGIASAHIEELSAALPGFAEAMAWPDG